MTLTDKIMAGSLGVCMVVLLALGIAYNTTSWGHPNNHNEAKYGVITLHALRAEWSAFEQTNLAHAATEATRLGPTVRVVYDAHLTTYTDPRDVVLREGTWDVDNVCASQVARYTPSTNTIELDPVCTHGTEAFVGALVHELGHAMGLHHVCLTAHETLTEPRCSPVGHGVAVMNPNVGYGSVDMSFTEASGGSDNQATVTPLDVEEFNLVHRH